MIDLRHGECIDVLRTLPDSSIDACVTDPPYGIGFMGKRWDYAVPSVDHWREVFRVLKPGAHLLSFWSTRTYHRGVVNIEDAGFEIRDSIAWVYGSGFPKSLDVSKAIDKDEGADRVLTRPGIVQRSGFGEDWDSGSSGTRPRYDEPATDAAKQWDGWGTALKPALEPIVVARKPLQGTVAENVQRHGTGAINVDACRIETADALGGGAESANTRKEMHEGWDRPWMHDQTAREAQAARVRENVAKAQSLGRWPANLVHDGSAEVVALFPDEAGAFAPVRGTEPSPVVANAYAERERVAGAFHGDAGSAARFFYCAKASREDRSEGLEGRARRPLNWSSGEQSPGTFESPNTQREVANHHPTVKPTDLMRWLVRLVTPPGGVVLDPFMGSGSTGKACKLEDLRFIGIEREADYVEIARARIEFAKTQTRLFA